MAANSAPKPTPFDVPLFDVDPVVAAEAAVAPSVTDVNRGAAAVAAAIDVEPVAVPVQRTLDDALREQAAQPQRAVLGSRARKWEPGTATLPEVKVAVGPGYLVEGRNRRDIDAIKGIQGEQKRQAAGKAYRLRQQGAK